MSESTFPQKLREIHNHHMDSTMWNDFAFRDDDTVISTYAKSGTTWVQQIVSQLIFNGATDIDVHEVSPWVDLRVPPKDEKIPFLEAQTHRRFLKTHLPVDALVFSDKAKYIYIGRDGRDVVWSFHNHHFNANDDFYEMLNGPGLVGPPIEPPTEDVVEYFREWLENDGYPIWPFWENIRTWWEIRDLPNVHLLHFNDLKKDMAGEIRKIAEFLEIDIDESRWDLIIEHCSFDYMKANAALYAPAGGTVWEGGGATFINKGVNGRWTDLLPNDLSQAYEAKALAELGPECRRWLATGA